MRTGDEKMNLKKKSWLLFMVMVVMLLLTACSGSTEDKILGGWKIVFGDKVTGYMELNEERYTHREGAGKDPMTLEYIVTDTQDGNFIFEIVNPETGIVEFIFEGFFENKNTINVLEEPNDEGEKRKMIRVDSVVEEMAKDEEVAQEKEQQEKAIASKEAEKQEKEQEALAKEEAKKQLEEDRVRESEEEQQQEESTVSETAIAATVEVNDANSYSQKAANLDDMIMSEAKSSYPGAQDIQPGFYGQYYDQWDVLLNEVWGAIQATIPSSEFENLKADQIEWIKMKEQSFAEIPKEPASERARGMDFLAFETKDRTDFLIAYYLD